ncbi:hypothetical protein EKO23_01135 [Nocardioides guangzhouensis]|uniref:Citrate transporter-like domain-containing protein n=1 Tax=Nocardioides guangzhouensis TaxID=2497878 RepID=A0A4Q4ZN46_9ACTN|nr:ArsB/NhaD family transporter [Nocardioides guangzhouensis]RYP89061.1 hypothetical protein EKO23_01135 [Nocardioides guangzhouensis]
MTTALVVVAFVAAYVLIATERIHRTAAALTGAAAMVMLGVVSAESAFFSEDTGIDWNVIFLLLGMMVIVSIIRRTGLFEYLAVWAAKRAGGRPFRLMVMLVVLTAVASAALDNVTTVLLVAPVTMLVCERLGVPAAPYLIAEVMASNIGGTSTLIGDPPNIIIASRGGLTFVDFLINLAPLVVLLMVVFIGLCWLMWGRTLPSHPERVEAVMRLDEREAIRDRGLLVKSLVVLAVVLCAFIAHGALDLDPAIVALLGAGALVAWSRLDPPEYLEEVEWSTLVFFMGLFVMVGSLVEVGVIDTLAEAMTDAVGGRYLAAGTILIWASGLMSGVVDNIPYVATMSPLVADLVAAGGHSDQAESLWWALAIGSDLGGNATAVGASANVVVLGVAARNGHPISFWQFTRYGLVVASVTIAVSWVYYAARYFLFS